MADPNNIILPEYKIAGFLLAKCGQTSIKVAFLRGLGYKGSLEFSAPGVAKLINGTTLFQYADKESIAELGPDWFTFTIVRNPWERVVSMWADKVRDNLHPSFERTGFIVGQEFDAFVKHLVKHTSPDKGADIHWRGQAHSIMVDGEIIPEYVGKLEEIEAAWIVIRARCADRGLDLSTLLHRNKTDHPDYTKLYKQRTKAMIAKYYAEDIEVFGYEF